MNRRIRNTLLAGAALWVLSIDPSDSQSACPYIIFGAVLTAQQWNQCFASKQDALGYIPLNQAGGIMTGKLTTTASIAGSAGLNIPQGVAPTTPVNGDVWTTAAGLYAQINGATQGPFDTAAGGPYLPQAGGTMTGGLVTAASALGGAGFNLPPGVTPTSPLNGDMWVNGTGFYVHAAGVTLGPFLNQQGGTLLGELVTKASAIGGAGFNLPQGAAPAAPVNGDMWATASGLYAQINGATQGPYATVGGGPFLALAGGTMTGTIIAQASGTGGAGFNIPPGATPNAFNGGDMWVTGTGVYIYISTGLTGPLFASGGTFTSEVFMLASTTGAASINLPAGTAPTSPVTGDVWETTAGLYYYDGTNTIGPLTSLPRYNSAGTRQYGEHMVQGTASAVGGSSSVTITLSGSAVFANNSYYCNATVVSSTAGQASVNQTSGSAFTLSANSNNQEFNYLCIGS